MSKRGWIGFDLDGTIAHYEKVAGARDWTKIGKPIAPMIALAKQLIADGWEVRIFTARMATRDPQERRSIEIAIAGWTFDHIGHALAATCVKDFGCVRIYDDRAVQVEFNTGRIIGEEAVAA